jgi:hypothetical protein
MTYQTPFRYRRTEAERIDPVLSWNRPDKAFFAAGACHILAWTFVRANPKSEFSLRGLREIRQSHVSHVYVSDGNWAFDHDGWNLEAELLAVTRSEAQRREDGARIESIGLHDNLVNFCMEHHHRLPSNFAYDPWPRATQYLSTFQELNPTAVEIDRVVSNGRNR